MEKNMKHWIQIGVTAAASIMMLVGCSRPPAAETSASASTGDHDVMIISSEADFEARVIQADRPVVVDFWATWCPPCRAMEPIIKTAASRHDHAIHVAKVDVDQNRSLAETFQIRSIPTFILYHQGQAIAQRVGGMRQGQFDDWIKQELGKAGVTTSPPAL
jgi:thioredoxin 1